MIIFFIIAISVIYSIAVGTNDAANSFGDWIGARVGKPLTGMFLCGFFALLGALLEGGKVSKTIGSGIISASYITQDVVIVGLIGACLWVAAATYFGMPISTTHSVVGGIAGLGLAMCAPVNWIVLKKIVICWLLTPTASFVISSILFYLLMRLLVRLNLYGSFSKLSGFILTFTSCYVAYTWGANDVGNAVALVISSNLLSVKMACLIGGFGIFTGAVLFGWKVSQTIGFEITRISPTMGVCADLATAFVIHAFTELKLPTSTTHALVGAVFGVGFARGRKLINFKIGRDIVFAWVITPIISGLISFCLYKIVKIL